MQELSRIIEQAWEQRAELSPAKTPTELRNAIEQCIAGLDAGTLRVASKEGSSWVVHQWLKKAVLLYFRINDNRVIEGGYTRFFD
jgi:2,3,4,5-tetrahydropyridine-2-carboxylate N-succinyltransferase